MTSVPSGDHRQRFSKWMRDARANKPTPAAAAHCRVTVDHASRHQEHLRFAEGYGCLWLERSPFPGETLSEHQEGCEGAGNNPRWWQRWWWGSRDTQAPQAAPPGGAGGGGGGAICGPPEGFAGTPDGCCGCAGVSTTGDCGFCAGASLKSPTRPCPHASQRIGMEGRRTWLPQLLQINDFMPLSRSPWYTHSHYLARPPSLAPR